MARASKKAVYAALFGNLAIAIAKLIAAIITGSTAMWAESYHSFSDTFNQVLLLVGLKTSKKAATERHQFGHGKEQFFWSFVVATMIFGISGVLSFQKGLESILNPEYHLENVYINYIILSIAIIFESNALIVAIKVFKKDIESHGRKFNLSSFFSEFRESKDPTILTVIVEDSAALLGIITALVGIFLAHITNNVIYDAISSLIIGCILMMFAIFLAKENKDLLIGEALSKNETKKAIKAILSIPEVDKVISMRSMHLSPEDVLIAIEVHIIDGITTDNIELIIDKIEHKVKEVIPYVNLSKIYVELERENKKSKKTS
ncbi:MAG: cation diffusion facilitator family transporter [Nitrososphaeraceae archaeon]